MEPLLTYKTAAAILDCSASKVQKMCLAGEIPIMKLGNETRIHPDDLKAWMDRSRHFHRPTVGRGICREDMHPDPIPTKEINLAKR